jgi:hypothetical protein
MRKLKQLKLVAKVCILSMALGTLMLNSQEVKRESPAANKANERQVRYLTRISHVEITCSRKHWYSIRKTNCTSHIVVPGESNLYKDNSTGKLIIAKKGN